MEKENRKNSEGFIGEKALLYPYRGHRPNERLEYDFVHDIDELKGDFRENGSFWDWETLPIKNPMLLEAVGYNLLKLRDAYMHVSIDIKVSDRMKELGRHDEVGLDDLTKEILSRVSIETLKRWDELSHSDSYVYRTTEDVLFEMLPEAFEYELSDYYVRSFLVLYDKTVEVLFNETGLESDAMEDYKQVDEAISMPFKEGIRLLIQEWIDTEKADETQEEYIAFPHTGSKMVPNWLKNLSSINETAMKTTGFRHLCEKALPERIYLSTLIFPRYLSRCERDKEHARWYEALPYLYVNMFDDTPIVDYEYDLEHFNPRYGGSHYALPILPTAVIKYYFEGETAEKLLYFNFLAQQELAFNYEYLIEDYELAKDYAIQKEEDERAGETDDREAEYVSDEDSEDSEDSEDYEDYDDERITEEDFHYPEIEPEKPKLIREFRDEEPL